MWGKKHWGRHCFLSLEFIATFLIPQVVNKVVYMLAKIDHRIVAGEQLILCGCITIYFVNRSRQI